MLLVHQSHLPFKHPMLMENWGKFYEFIDRNTLQTGNRFLIGDLKQSKINQMEIIHFPWRIGILLLGEITHWI